MQQQTVQPSIINYQKLKARKSYFSITNEQLAQAAQISVPTVSAFMNGKDSVTLKVMKRLAAALKYRVRVDFEPFDADRNAFAALVAEQGMKFVAHFDPPRNSWLITQETALSRAEIGVVYGLENERLAKFIVDSLNGSA